VLAKQILRSLHWLQSRNSKDILLADPRHQAPKRKTTLMVILHLQDREHDVFAEAKGYSMDDSIKESESGKSELTTSWPLILQDNPSKQSVRRAELSNPDAL
jgi:hypothetical protein